MKDFRDLVLCDYHNDKVEIHVKADITDGKLTVAGHDLGRMAEEVWGDSDYEYWYTFDKEETIKLIDAIDGTSDPQSALLNRFKGEKGCNKLKSFCKKKGIEYGFFSYI